MVNKASCEYKFVREKNHRASCRSIMAYDRIIVSHCEWMTVIYHWGDKRLPDVHTSTLLRSYRGPCMEPCTAILDSMTEGRCMAFTGIHRHGPPLCQPATPGAR